MLIAQMRDSLVSLPEEHRDFVWAVQGVSWYDAVALLALLLVVGLVVRWWRVRRRFARNGKDQRPDE